MQGPGGCGVLSWRHLPREIDLCLPTHPPPPSEMCSEQNVLLVGSGIMEQPRTPHPAPAAQGCSVDPGWSSIRGTSSTPVDVLWPVCGVCCHGSSPASRRKGISRSLRAARLFSLFLPGPQAWAHVCPQAQPLSPSLGQQALAERDKKRQR